MCMCIVVYEVCFILWLSVLTAVYDVYMWVCMCVCEHTIGLLLPFIHFNRAAGCTPFAASIMSDYFPMVST